eukprot:8015960-Pyramimonas_sp.AAC.1
MGLGSKGDALKWTDVRPRAARLLHMAMNGSERDKVLSDLHRWSEPPPADVAFISAADARQWTPSDVCVWPVHVRALLGWNHKLLNRVTPAIDCGVGLSETCGDDDCRCPVGTRLFIPAEKHFSTTTFVIAVVVAVGDDGTRL